MVAIASRDDRPGPAVWLLSSNCGRRSIDRLISRRPPDPSRVPVEIYRTLQVSCDLPRQLVEPSGVLPDISRSAVSGSCTEAIPGDRATGRRRGATGAGGTATSQREAKKQ